MKSKALAIDYIDRKSKHKFHLPLSVFKKPSNDKEYKKLEKILEQLIDAVRDDENHPLALAMQIIGENLEDYDNTSSPAIGEDVRDVEMVKHLMQSYQLQQKDLAQVFGGQGNISKFLNGERSLGKNQILGLKKRFHLSADFFLKE